nr:MAG TPA: hypothetical protein [Caudoviricetes sp.]
MLINFQFHVLLHKKAASAAKHPRFSKRQAIKKAA